MIEVNGSFAHIPLYYKSITPADFGRLVDLVRTIGMLKVGDFPFNYWKDSWRSLWGYHQLILMSMSIYTELVITWYLNSDLSDFPN